MRLPFLFSVNRHRILVFARIKILFTNLSINNPASRGCCFEGGNGVIHPGEITHVLSACSSETEF